MSEPQEVRIIGPVITNTENPWRTQGDYRVEQRQQNWLFSMQVITILIAIASLAASAYFSSKASSEKQKVVIEVIHRYIAEEPAVAKTKLEKLKSAPSAQP